MITLERPQKYSSKLIFVDGLPGSGKSTTAQFVALQLQKHNLKARWFYEVEEPHPIHYWDATNRDEFARKSLQLWRSFAASAGQSDEVTVLESSLFQRTLGLVLARYENINEEWLIEYYAKLQDIIVELAPMLVYYYQTDVAEFMEKVFTERGDVWTQWFIGFVTQSPIGQQRNWAGREGAIAFLEVYKALCGELFSRFSAPKIAIENSAGEWAGYYQQIMTFLELSWLEDKAITESFLRQVVGKYKDSDFECEVRSESGQLTVNNIWWPVGKFVPLIPTGANSFLVRGSPIELIFEQQSIDEEWRMYVGGDWGEHKGKVLYQQPRV